MIYWMVLLFSLNVIFIAIQLSKKRLTSHIKNNIAFLSVINIASSILTWLDFQILSIILTGIIFVINYTLITLILNKSSELKNLK
ncbi:hypothetical protein CF651_31300 [Paenibacillus rigui]|uniref:Uncharacterized protein n=1 Tax=Paenibacillus rigui TaxID=554312 RepID=A0A229UG58_9BACL|nr:hypothetical protein CF651_31300 [Paenibacillus rigui]